MILALMPLGVEHPVSSFSSALRIEVILALMPLGVEHRAARGDQSTGAS